MCIQIIYICVYIYNLYINYTHICKFAIRMITILVVYIYGKELLHESEKKLVILDCSLQRIILMSSTNLCGLSTNIKISR